MSMPACPPPKTLQEMRLMDTIGHRTHPSTTCFIHPESHTVSNHARNVVVGVGVGIAQGERDGSLTHCRS